MACACRGDSKPCLTMLIHSVYFWLKSELIPAQRAEFLTALQALKAVPSVKQFYLGKPAGVTPRPVVDLSFDYSITCVFDNVDGHNAYQVHPLHLAFVNTGKPLWTKVQIYDAE